MSWQPFSARVPAKWVLAGEHAVLRGGTAVALPHPELELRLRFEPAGSEGLLEIHPPEIAVILQELLRSMTALREQPGAGRLMIESSIPLGAGLGSSAALCVAVTRWLSGALGLRPEDERDFATKLENLFHGKSSGMDVAVVSSGVPIVFARGKLPEPLAVRGLPRFSFHDTGLRARTSECVTRVEAFGLDHPASARELDARMSEAAISAAHGLRQYGAGQPSSRDAGLERIAQAMRDADACMRAWGLVPARAEAIAREQLDRGARAARLTGAGGGGMVVALWE